LAGAAGAQITVTDVAIETRLQDAFLDEFKRGRALIAADFNLDGRTDFYLGNPSDTSIFAVDSATEGLPRLEIVQVIDDGLLAWGAAAADYDNDGDYDLFIAAGGNECPEADRLYRNLWMENGELSFEDVTDEAGVAGPKIPNTGEIQPMASANGVWLDYNRDGDMDLFVNGNNRVACGQLPKVMGRNTLWHNNGDGTFTDMTIESGLFASLNPTRHSSALDIDNDGYYDIYENNFEGGNVLWHNQGDGTFSNATAEFSLPGEDMAFPANSFVSCPGDFNNDGWEDLMVFARDDEDIITDCSEVRPERRVPVSGARFETSPYALGHALFLNEEGIGFGNRAISAGLNSPYIASRGVMGSQIGDLNGDGVLDIYIGNGGPGAGERDQLLLSDRLSNFIPVYEDGSHLVDFPAPEDPQAPPGSYPDYPYRTHGTVILDIDGDGGPELLVSNGGPSELSGLPEEWLVPEPNRAFKFDWGPDHDLNYLKIRLQGDGDKISRDAIGTRVTVTVSKDGGEPWAVRRTLFGGSCFSAQNSFILYFGLGDADTIERVTVLWPDGTVDMFTEGLEVNSQLPLFYGR